MKITFSRHARRRMDLYKINEDDVMKIIKSAIINKEFLSGKHEEVDYDLKTKYGYPLKVVFVIENDQIVVITTYPLRKGRLR